MAYVDWMIRTRHGGWSRFRLALVLSLPEAKQTIV